MDMFTVLNIINWGRHFMDPQIGGVIIRSHLFN